MNNIKIPTNVKRKEMINNATNKRIYNNVQ